MPVQQLQIPTSNINNLVDQSTWAGLGNLGNVYQEAQDKARERATLASLGTDPTSNIAALLKSGNPTLVQLGMRLQQEQVANRQSGAYLSIAQDRARREQEAADLAEEQRLAAPGLYTQLLGGGGAPGTAPSAPFPAPLPGRNVIPPGAVPPQGAPAMPPAMPPGMPPPAPPAAPPISPVQPGDLDARIAQSAQQLSGSGAAYPGVTPMPAATAAPPITPPPTAPPIKAEGEEGGLPAWAGPQSLAGRMLGNLVAGRPAAAAGISNKVLGEALANPETKALATVFAQNKINPGTWTIHHDPDSGRFVAFNNQDPAKTIDVTPPLPAGVSPHGRTGLGQPIYARDPATGELTAYQLSSRGEPVPVTLPGGQKILGPGEMAQQKAEGAAVGKGAGGAITALPDVIRVTDNLVNTIDKITGHEGKELALGRGSHLPDWMVAGTRIADFRALVGQLGGEAMQQNMSSLRGAGLGSVSDFEQRNLMNAFVRASTAQTKEGFDDAMADARKSALEIKRIAQAKAKGDFSGAGAPAPPISTSNAAPPAPGGVVDYRTYFGK